LPEFIRRNQYNLSKLNEKNKNNKVEEEEKINVLTKLFSGE
jgi:hypothetical protein